MYDCKYLYHRQRNVTDAAVGHYLEEKAEIVNKKLINQIITLTWRFKSLAIVKSNDIS